MKIFRKRFIPNEIIDISNDKVLYVDDEMLITEWLPIKPREDVKLGKSYAYLKKGWKISRFMDEDHNLLYWYCDIIDAQIDNDVYTLVDLLVDIKVYPDGTYEVLDLDELDEAIKLNLIDESKKEEALNKMNELLEIVKNSKFPPADCLR